MSLIVRMKNRFGFRVVVGQTVRMHLPRGGYAEGMVTSIAPRSGWGRTLFVQLDCGYSGTIDDCFSADSTLK